MSGLITDYLNQGDATDRPAAPDVPAGVLAFYLATDTSILSVYDWDSPGWVDVDISGGSSGGIVADAGLYSVTAGAALDITLSTAYQRHLIVFQVSPATDGADINMQVTDDAFATVKSGASDYSWVDGRGFSSNSDTTSTGHNTTLMKMATNVGNATARRLMGEITVDYARDAAVPTHFGYNHTRINSTNAINRGYGAGRHNIALAINGVRLVASSGNITGTAHVYGFPPAT